MNPKKTSGNHLNLVIQSDLFGMVKWPLKGLSDLQLEDKKVTKNHLESTMPIFTTLSVDPPRPGSRAAQGPCDRFGLVARELYLGDGWMGSEVHRWLVGGGWWVPHFGWEVGWFFNKKLMICIQLLYIYTWNPAMARLFWLEFGPCFGGLTFKNRGELGSRYMH